MKNTLTDYLEYISSIVDNYLSGDKREKSTDEIEIIKSKIEDPFLNLAVVGEFSSGKSTFINAFLRKHLLKAACKATTASATYLERVDSDFFLEVTFLDKKISASEQNYSELKFEVNEYSEIEINSIYDLLNSLTSEQSVADHVKQIDLKVPDNSLPLGIKLIDTPGINPGDKLAMNHISITENIVANVADMAIVLIPAHAAMSSTLEKFLSTNLRRFLHRCIFVVTRMDDELPDTRGEIEDHVKNRLINNLKIENPTIYHQSAITMLPVKKIPVSKQDEWDYWREQFTSFEKDIWNQLKQKKEVVISEHLYYLLNNVLNNLQNSLKLDKKELEKTKEILSKGKISRIEKLTSVIQSTAKTKIDKEIRLVANKIRNQESHYMNKSLQAANAIIEGGGNLSSFKWTETPKIVKMVQGHTQEYIGEINKLFKNLEKTTNEITNAFESEFQKHYSMFPFLNKRINVRKISIDKISLPNLNFTSSVSYIKREEEKKEEKTKWGAIGGGLVGFIVGGPIGAVIGAGAGGFGTARVVELTNEEIQDQVKSKTQRDIKSFYTNLKEQLDGKVKSRKNSILKDLDRICQNHTKKYGEKVQALMQEQEKKERELEKKISSIADEIEKLKHMEDEVELKRTELKLKYSN